MVVRILRKFNSKAAKVATTRARNGHHGAGMTWRGWRSGQPDATRGPLQEARREKADEDDASAPSRSSARSLATPAAAADLYGKAPAFAAAPFNGYNWNGAYVGVNLGYQWGKVTNWGSTEPNGVMGGGQIGYNWQYGQFVFGAEADLQGSGAEDTFAAYKFSNPWFGTVRGRAGYAMNNVLAYATGGLAYGGGRVDFGAFSESQTHLGWTIGARRRGRADAELDGARPSISMCGSRTAATC